MKLRETISRLVNGKPLSETQANPEQAERASVSRWADEITMAEKFFEKFHKQGKVAVDKDADEGTFEHNDLMPNYRLNLFHSNIVTLKSQLYARLPKVEADRRFLDPNDDVARVASEMVTRILQNDMNDPEDTLNEVLKAALHDRLVPGLGAARVLYRVEEKPGDVIGEDGTPIPVKSDEWCDIVHVHWTDYLHNPCRTAAEVRWKAFRSYLTKEEVAERFGEDVSKLIPYQLRTGKQDRAAGFEDIEQATAQAEIWEIWDSTSKCCYWFVKGYDKFLDKRENPMELSGFFPDARPMIANPNTKKYLPKPDYEFARSLYEKIDRLEQRISLLTEAAKAVGVYDRQSKDVQRMLTEGVENQLIPVDNWAMFAEKGGLRGVVDWLPIEQIVNAIQVLSAQQVAAIQQLFQITGMSDIIRGQATQGPQVSATEQRIKAQFASTRIQSLQDDFASFAADLLNKKVQIISKYYDPERIKALSNIMATPDAQLADQAVALIKDSANFNIRIAVRAESMAQIDYDMLRQERTEFLGAVSQYLGQSAGLLEQSPEAAPFLMQLLQFGVSGFKAANEMEGVIDQAIAQVQNALQQKAQQPPPPSPEQIKAQLEEKKLQQEAQIAQGEQQMEMQKVQAELQRDREKHTMEMEKLKAEMLQQQREHDMRMQELQAKLQATLIQTQAKAEADTRKAEMAEETHERKEAEARSANSED